MRSTVVPQTERLDLAATKTMRTLARYVLDRGIGYHAALLGFRMAIVLEALGRAGRDGTRDDASDILGTSRQVVYHIFKAYAALLPAGTNIRSVHVPKARLCPICSLTKFRPAAPTAPYDELVQAYSRQVVADALMRANGNRTYAAQMLGLKPESLRRRIYALRRHGIILPVETWARHQSPPRLPLGPAPTCRWCGKPVPPTRRRVCSDECVQAAARHAQRNRRGHLRKRPA